MHLMHSPYRLSMLPAILIAATILPLGDLLSADDAAVLYAETTGSEAEAKEMAGYSFPKEMDLRVDLFAGVSFFHDSNTSLTPVALSASVVSYDFGFDIMKGSNGSPGVFYGLNYTGNAYSYDTGSTFGRDSLEQKVGAQFGVNGGKTRFRFSTDYYRNNGNSTEFDQLNRETRRAQSDDFNFNFALSRDLAHGSLEFGAGLKERDFDSGTGVNDENGQYGDIAWFYRPGFAPKSNVGLGFRFGQDDYSANPDQEYYTPSVRYRYAASSRTSFHSSLGYEYRDSDNVGAIENTGIVYDGGMSWVPSAKTSFNFSFYKNNRPSYVTGGEDVDSTGIVLQMSNALPAHFTLSNSLGYENAEYSPNTAGVVSTREDDFLRYRVSLGHPLRLTDQISGNVSVFYTYSDNDSTLAGATFEQHVTGVRFGVMY
jgi:hypothetical protein